MHHRFSPFFLQVEHIPQRVAGECLAACGVMVLRYMGIQPSYRQIVRTLQIQPSLGTPFYKIQELRRIGIAVTYRQGSLTTLYSTLQQGFPCIVPVNTAQLPYWNGVHSQHAVVVVGLDEDYIYLNDPEFAIAPTIVSHGDFDLAWFDQGEYFAILTP